MTTLEWEDATLYRIAVMGYRASVVAHVFAYEDKWALRFYVAVNGQYRFEGFDTEQDAKNMAIILWRANNE